MVRHPYEYLQFYLQKN
ncbi:hypothetical protein FO524_13015 [Bacillus mycoides]|nr:hypothetical protein [Bacillus mycoides]QWH53857.1 hypothetical protein EXW44_12025 [Bacillus mycoides]